jgi:hypothetical protein
MIFTEKIVLITYKCHSTQYTALFINREDFIVKSFYTKILFFYN